MSLDLYVIVLLSSFSIIINLTLTLLCCTNIFFVVFYSRDLHNVIMKAYSVSIALFNTELPESLYFLFLIIIVAFMLKWAPACKTFEGYLNIPLIAKLATGDCFSSVKKMHWHLQQRPQSYGEQKRSRLIILTPSVKAKVHRATSVNIHSCLSNKQLQRKQ